MNYASVCSGVEAASLACLPLGWKPVWFSEIEKFPCEVLKYRFPGVPNLGDMTKIRMEKTDYGQKFYGENNTFSSVYGGVDLLVGGTPCQGFSVAGKQGGLDDERSGLAMCYVGLLGTIRPEWFVWENVPGVFSTNEGRDVKAFFSAIDELGYSVAWRVLDAQYCRVDGYPRAVPQRRRRVIAVGHLGGDWRYPASVLFEPEGVHGDTPPRRTKREKASGDTVPRPDDTGRSGDASVDSRWWSGGQIADALTCTSDAQREQDKGRLQCVVCYDNHGTNGFVTELKDNVSSTVKARWETGGNNIPVLCYDARGNGNGLVSPNVTGDHGNRVTDYTPLAVQCAIETGNDQTLITRDTVPRSDGTGRSGASSVRRLTPLECERLMGFPDYWTRIPVKEYNVKPSTKRFSDFRDLFRGNEDGTWTEYAADGPRYKACGNSMCVNVMRWVGKRIEKVEKEGVLIK